MNIYLQMWLEFGLFIVSLYTRKLLLHFTDIILNSRNLTFFNEYVLNKWMNQWVNKWYFPKEISYFIKMYILIWCCKAHAKNKFQMLSTKYYIMFFGVIRFFS